ncbi:MAG: radical SAM protein [Suipraeoptans sp.]
MDRWQKSAPVRKIILFSSVDGPGNRSAVFLQGCNFNCRYCHNPETRNVYEPGISKMSAEEVMEQVSKNIPFIRGITVSGGECMLYPEFVKALFKLCKEKGLGTLIDSNGSVDFRNHTELLDVTDGVMLDIKAWDNDEHLSVTDASNTQVLANALYLAEAGKLYEVRTVVVPGLFDYEQTITETAKLLKPFLENEDIRYKLIKYRNFGVRKEYKIYKSPSAELMKSLNDTAKAAGFKNVVVV